jgi:hypothetical protein
VTCAREQRADVYRHAEARKALGHLLDPCDACFPLARQKDRERRVGVVDEVAKQVHVASVIDSGNFDAGNHVDVPASGGYSRLDDGSSRIVVGDRHAGHAGGARAIDQFRRGTAAIGRGGVQVKIDHPALTPGVPRGRPSPRGRAMRAGRTVARRRLAAASLALDERAVFAHEQIEMVAFLVRELEEDLLAFGVLEPLAVFLEEAMRVAFAADADEQRLLVVDALQQAIGAFGKQPVRGALEEQERGTRFELWIARQQIAVAASSFPRCSFSSAARSWNTFRPRASRATRAARE